MGDGMDGLAWAIAGASLCFLLVPAALGGLAGFFALRKRAPAVGVIVGALIGAGLGALAVTATFYETSFSPPDTLVIETPSPPRHATVIFVEDATATTDVTWTGSHFPMSAREGRIVVPASGLLRVRSVAWIYGREVRASLSDGSTETGLRVADVPGVGSVVILGFSTSITEPDLLSLEPAALAPLIHAREAER